MDYLYKALKREVGVIEAEPALFSPLKAQRAEPVPAVRGNEPVAPSLSGRGKPVAFPAKLERLFTLRSEGMNKEHVDVLEQYRVLRSRVLEIMRMHGMRTLMVTSAVSGESKTTIAINLALALSQVQGLKVLLVDTDLRKAGIAEVLGIPYEIGLQDYLRSPMPLSDMMLQLTNTLSFIPSGGIDQNSAELLHSAAMLGLVNQVQSYFDLIIFDSPPLFPIADARVTANLMDAILFCVSTGKASETIISEAAALIRPKLIGTVRVGAEVRTSSAYYYSHGYGVKE
jgi:capsular exopolysaccharide synthesis family protein